MCDKHNGVNSIPITKEKRKEKKLIGKHASVFSSIGEQECTQTLVLKMGHEKMLLVYFRKESLDSKVNTWHAIGITS